MSTHKSMSRIERIRRTGWWPPVAYYAGLVKSSPRLVFRAANDVERWVSVGLLIAAVAGVTISLGRQEYQLAGLIFALVVIVGFLRLNYQEIETRDAKIE